FSLSGYVLIVVVLGAFLAPQLQRRLTFGQAIIGLSWCYTATLLLFSVAGSPVLIMALLVAISLATPSYDTVQMSYTLLG
ncbi:MAG: hypothetical protein M3Q65_02265, partial [Chloroflexota bacterium]|nr:hypothetical protein [Chloroflexota bacterium]